jgi:hypothetical protein
VDSTQGLVARWRRPEVLEDRSLKRMNRGKITNLAAVIAMWNATGVEAQQDMQMCLRYEPIFPK